MILTVILRGVNTKQAKNIENIGFLSPILLIVHSEEKGFYKNQKNIDANLNPEMRR